jgi:hypothetical protein
LPLPFELSKPPLVLFPDLLLPLLECSLELWCILNLLASDKELRVKYLDFLLEPLLLLLFDYHFP